jgi:hypothetical protein
MFRSVPGTIMGRVRRPVPLGRHPRLVVERGEALSAAWLTAIQLGLSLTPMGAVVEVDRTR